MPATRTLIAPTVEERREIVGGIETRVLEVTGGGDPWLLVHGFADSADTWRPLLDRLGAAGRMAAALDLAGFGTAAPLDSAEPLLPQWDGMVGEAIERLSAASGGRRVLIAGNSLGGCLTLRAAGRPGLPIAGAVPIAPAGLDMARWIRVIEGEPLLRLLRLSPVPLPERVVREVVGRAYRSLAFARPRAADPELVAAFTSHIRTVERGEQILDLGRRMLPELTTDPFELDGIDCPLLLIWGERDVLVYTTGAERVLRTVPYSDIEIIPDCGHCPQLELPDRMAELLLDFPASSRP